MKGILLSASTVLFLTHLSLSHANPIPMTIVNNASDPATVTVANSPEQTIKIGPAQVKMLNVEFTYPTRFFIRDGRFSQTRCDWSNPLIGKQTVRNIVLTISQSPGSVSSGSKNCLIEWR